MQRRITMPIAITTPSLSALLSTVMVAVKKGYAITTYPYLPPIAILEPLW
jgi:hypothetical protein